MKDETLHEEKLRIFDTYYERLCKERNSDDCAIRYSVVEYLCSFPRINPVYMAKKLNDNGYKIVFDDTSISQSANNRKRMEVFDYEYRKRKGLGTTIPMFLDIETVEDFKKSLEEEGWTVYGYEDENKVSWEISKPSPLGDFYFNINCEATPKAIAMAINEQIKSSYELLQTKDDYIETNDVDYEREDY